MQNEIILSDYSYHTDKKVINWKSGLDYFFIRLQTQGQCYAKINGDLLKVSTGDLLLCKPGDKCELIMDEYTDFSGNKTISSGDLYLMCKGPWIEQWWERKSRNTLQHIIINRKIRVLWKEIIIENRRIYKESGELVDYLLKTLCLSIDSVLNNINLFPHSPSQAALEMKGYIEENATRPLKVKDVADHVGFSISRASHLFKESFGKTIIQYTIQIRLNTALNLIKYNDMSMEQIATISGFGSYTYFYRVFRKEYGVSPTKYYITEK